MSGTHASDIYGGGGGSVNYDRVPRHILRAAIVVQEVERKLISQSDTLGCAVQLMSICLTEYLREHVCANAVKCIWLPDYSIPPTPPPQAPGSWCGLGVDYRELVAQCVH